jgi:pyruvate-ferredoxin/flavodoxin oxidoreductase
MIMKKKTQTPESPKYPGTLEAMDGSDAVVSMETAASEAAGAYPITPSTQMGEGWAAAVAAGKTNVNGRRLIFFEPEGEHAAAAVTAGMSMMGLRATNFSSGQGIAYMHESLYAAAGKRLTYVLNVAARAMTKHALNVHAGHDDYHAIDDTGFFQLFSKNVQEAADLTLIAHRIAELSLTPGVSAQDGFLTSHVIESLRLPERALVKEYLGDPSDVIESPTPAQRMVFGETRRRIPELFDLDYPSMFGVVQNQDSYAQGVAAQRPFYFDHVVHLADQAMEEYAALTGRRYARAAGYMLDDAEYVLAGQGTLVTNAEAVAKYLRETRGLKIGVLNLTMFRPFPADLVTALLKGRKAVTVLERADQPLAVDGPLLREIRAAMTQGMENWRAGTRNGRPGATTPFTGLAPVAPDDMPDFYEGGFGFGSRDLQAGDLVAAVNNMLPDGQHRRHFYLGIDFVEKKTRAPKLQIWQEELLQAYPDLAGLALDSVGDLDLMPDDSISIRIHSIGGWGAITMGKNIALTAFELLGLNIKANPKYGSEKKGQPTNFYATLSRDELLINAELKHVDLVLSPDPNVFKNGDPLSGLAEGGVFVIQSDQEPGELWETFPAEARRTIVERNIKVFTLDAFKIAVEEASDPDLRYRMQGTAFLGSFFKASPLAEREGLDEDKLFEGIRAQIQHKFGHRGERVVEDNVRVIRRGYDELREVPLGDVGQDEPGAHVMPVIPHALDVPEAQPGVGNPGRFWEQVCAYCATTGNDVIADPFAAISAIPAATSSVRDMTNIRFEVPDFIAEKCTGCSQCWMQCPDAAIPGVVNTVEEVLDAAIVAASNGRSYPRLTQIAGHLARESRKIMKGVPFTTFGDVLSSAYENVVPKLGWDAERTKTLDDEFSAVFPHIAEFPLAKTRPFFDVPESREKREPRGVQGLQHLRGRLSRERPDHRAPGRGDRRPAPPQLGHVGVSTGHGRPLRQHLQPRRRHRCPLVPASQEEELPIDGRRRRRLHGLRREDRRPHPGLHDRGADDPPRREVRREDRRSDRDAGREGPGPAGRPREPRRGGPGSPRGRGAARGGAGAHPTPQQGDPRAEGPEVAVRGGTGGPGSGAHGHEQLHRLLVRVGEHVSVQPVPLPLGEPPLPGRALHRHRPVRRPHAQDGRQLRVGASGRAPG